MIIFYCVQLKKYLSVKDIGKVCLKVHVIMATGSKHTARFTANVINTNMLTWPPKWYILVLVHSEDKMKISMLWVFSVWIRFLKCLTQCWILIFRVRVFGNTVLRRILGLKREELEGFIVSLIKYRKMRCLNMYE